MRRREVDFTPEARVDLFGIVDRVSAARGAKTALAYAARIEEFCYGLALASERGTLRDDVRPGLRIVGFERRITVAFAVGPDRVSILRPFGRGLDWERAFR